MYYNYMYYKLELGQQCSDGERGLVCGPLIADCNIYTAGFDTLHPRSIICRPTPPPLVPQANPPL